MTLTPGVRRLVTATALFGSGYLLAVLGVSLSSRERVLGVNHPKHFCGLYLDCHREVSLLGVDAIPAIGGQRARGTFAVVTLRFSSTARRAVMRTGSLSAVVVDDTGRRFRRARSVEAALGDGRVTSGLPDAPMVPGGAFTTRIAFDLPADVRHPRLYIWDSDVTARLTELLLVGDEDSLLHARTTFALEPAGRS
jgi:hypothetical protein